MQALDIITESLRDIGVISEVATPSAEQGAIAVTKLNELMASLEEDGIDFGWPQIASTTDTVVIPLAHRATIKALLAIRLAPMYAGSSVPAVVASIADSGYTRLLGQAVSAQIERSQSDTLPLGQNSLTDYNIQNGY